MHGIDVSASHLLLRFRQKSQLLFALFLLSVGSGLEEAVALGSRSEGDDIVYQTTSADGKKKRNCYKKSKMGNLRQAKIIRKNAAKCGK